jgi:hypothetical protein
MKSFYLAVASGLIVNGVHGYLLWSQRDERKWSISVHAARDRRTYTIYLIGHLLAGLFFALFAYEFFVTIHDLQWLFWLSILGLMFEYIQAILPAKGKTNTTHAVTAYAMFISYAFVAVFSMFVLDISTTVQVLVFPFLLLIPIFGVVAVRNRNKMYFAQMISICSFSLVMIIFAVGS